MLQVDWQQEAKRARGLFLAAPKEAQVDALLQRPSANLDLEAPRGSAASLEAVTEQATAPDATLGTQQLPF